MSTEALVVDDCRVESRIISQFMEDLGFNVTTVPSGESAMEYLAQRATPSVVLVDWVMPGMSGVELVSWLRGQPALQRTPVLMVTAERELERVAQALSEGANEYIMKPVSKEALADKLRLLGIPVAP